MIFSERIGDHTVLKKTLNPKVTVIDAGFNRGDFSTQVASQFSVNVIALEPEPSLFFNAYIPDKVDLRNVALAAEDGVNKLFEYHDHCASLHEVQGAALHKVHEIQAVTLSSLIAGSRSCELGLLKMDIEGEEMAILELTPSSVLKQFPQITVEFHLRHFPSHRERYRKVKKRMQKDGFSAINFSNREATDVLFFRASIFRFPRLAYLTLVLEKYISGILRIVTRRVDSV